MYEHFKIPIRFSHRQLSIILRYVPIKDVRVEAKESVVNFVPTLGKTAQHITDIILTQFNEYHINIQDCRYEAYDNASTISGIHTGVHKRIKEINSLATFVSFANYSLNLSGVHAAKANPEAITFFGTVDRI